MHKPVTRWWQLFHGCALLLWMLATSPAYALPGRAPQRQPAATGLTATPSTLAAFATSVGSASAQQGVYVGGTDLTGTVTATAPAGFEVSWTSGANFGASQVLTQSGGTFANVPLYVRLTGAALGNFSGNVTLASPGAVTLTIAVTGTVSSIQNPNPVATVTSIAPTTGMAGVPTLVDFYGTNFVPGIVVTITAVNGGTSFSVGPTTFISSTHVTALVQSTAVVGTIRGYVEASNPAPGGGGNTPPSSIFYSAAPAPPVITSFSPTSGPIGTKVTIQGYNLFVNSSGTTYNSVISFNGTPTIGNFPGGTSTEVYVPVGATTGFITLTNPNGGAVSAIPFTVTSPHPGFFEDFEQGTKAAYAPASVQLRSGGWTFGEALIGTSAGADKFNDTRAARLRGGGVLEMDTDKPGGAGVVTVSAATYATEAGASFVPEISTDGGITYQSLLPSGTAPPVLTSTLTAYSFTANRGGNVRLRFSSTNLAATTNPRLNLDDIGITDYVALATSPAASLPGVQVYPNPAHDRLTVTGTGPAGAQVTLLDVLGRPVLPATAVPDGQALPLPATLPAGLYLLRVRTAAGLHTQRIVKE